MSSVAAEVVRKCAHNPEFQPQQNAWWTTAKTALDAALSTSVDLVVSFRTGVPRGVRLKQGLGTWFEHRVIAS